MFRVSFLNLEMMKTKSLMKNIGTALLAVIGLFVSGESFGQITGSLSYDGSTLEYGLRFGITSTLTNVNENDLIEISFPEDNIQMGIFVPGLDIDMSDINDLNTNLATNTISFRMKGDLSTLALPIGNLSLKFSECPLTNVIAKLSINGEEKSTLNLAFQIRDVYSIGSESFTFGENENGLNNTNFENKVLQHNFNLNEQTFGGQRDLSNSVLKYSVPADYRIKKVIESVSGPTSGGVPLNFFVKNLISTNSTDLIRNVFISSDGSFFELNQPETLYNGFLTVYLEYTGNQNEGSNIVFKPIITFNYTEDGCDAINPSPLGTLILQSEEHEIELISNADQFSFPFIDISNGEDERVTSLPECISECNSSSFVVLEIDNLVNQNSLSGSFNFSQNLESQLKITLPTGNTISSITLFSNEISSFEYSLDNLISSEMINVEEEQVIDINNSSSEILIVLPDINSGDFVRVALGLESNNLSGDVSYEVTQNNSVFMSGNYTLIEEQCGTLLNTNSGIKNPEDNNFDIPFQVFGRDNISTVAYLRLSPDELDINFQGDLSFKFPDFVTVNEVTGGYFSSNTTFSETDVLSTSEINNLYGVDVSKSQAGEIEVRSLIYPSCNDLNFFVFFDLEIDGALPAGTFSIELNTLSNGSIGFKGEEIEFIQKPFSFSQNNTIGHPCTYQNDVPIATNITTYEFELEDDYDFDAIVNNTSNGVIDEVDLVVGLPTNGNTNLVDGTLISGTINLENIVIDEINVYEIINGAVLSIRNLDVSDFTITYSDDANTCFDFLGSSQITDASSCSTNWSSVNSVNDKYIRLTSNSSDFNLFSDERLVVSFKSTVSTSNIIGDASIISYGVSSRVNIFGALSENYFASSQQNLLVSENPTCVTIITTPPPCERCIESFTPLPDSQYVVSAWVMEENFEGKAGFENAKIVLSYELDDGSIERDTLSPNGQIIDGWQRIEEVIRIPAMAFSIDVQLFNKTNTEGNRAYFDDIRLHPFNSNMKSFVYDPRTWRLWAELDERNYATYYEYDEEGALVRVKKETERGIKTIQESRNSIKKDKKTN